MVWKVCQQSSQNEVFRGGVERRAHQDEDKLCNEDVDGLHMVNRVTATDKAGDPDTRSPCHEATKLLPVVSDERLVYLNATKNRKEDSKGNWRCFIWIVRIK